MRASIRIEFLEVEALTYDDIRAGKGPELVRCTGHDDSLRPVSKGVEIFGGTVQAVQCKDGKLRAVTRDSIVTVSPTGYVNVFDRETFNALFATVA
jgi:hypothetical protein